MDVLSPAAQIIGAVNTIVNDIINNSLDKPYLLLSEPVYNALKSLKKFNYKYIYDKANSKEQIAKYEENTKLNKDQYSSSLTFSSASMPAFKFHPGIESPPKLLQPLPHCNIS